MRFVRLFIIGSFGCLLFTAACLQRDAKREQDVLAQADPNSRAQQKVTEQKEVTKEDAARMAENHLALKKANWGKLEQVVERDNKFYVGFETPEREMRLVGQRVLVVDKETGVVSFQKRR